MVGRENYNLFRQCLSSFGAVRSEWRVKSITSLYSNEYRALFTIYRYREMRMTINSCAAAGVSLRSFGTLIGFRHEKCIMFANGQLIQNPPSAYGDLFVSVVNVIDSTWICVDLSNP